MVHIPPNNQKWVGNDDNPSGYYGDPIFRETHLSLDLQ